MKTILQINKFHYICGGADRYYFNLSELLRKKGHRVVNFSMKDERNEPSEWSDYFVGNIDISKTHFDLAGLRKAARIIYSLESKRKIEQLIKDIQPDIAHIHNIYHQISPSILPVLKKYNIPVVMNLHDYKLISPNYKFLCRGKICEHKRKYYREIFHKSIKDSYIASSWCVLETVIHNVLNIYKNNIDLYLAPSEFIKNKFVEYGFEPDKIKVLPYALDTDKYGNLPNKTVAQRYILYLGRLSEEKGIEVLIEAMKNIKNKVLLKIVGEGSLLDDLKRKKELEGLDNIEFVGFQSGDKLKQIISDSEFVVVPSVWYENSPLVIYEAMALGKTVIGSRIGGIPELIKEGVTGLLFEAGDSRELATKIDYLLDNDKVLTRMGEAAKVESLRFGFDKHYEKIMEVYNLITHNS